MTRANPHVLSPPLELMFRRHCDALSALLRQQCLREGEEQHRPGAIYLLECGQFNLWDQLGLEDAVLERLHHVLPHRREKMQGLCRAGQGVGVEDLSGLSWTVFQLSQPGGDELDEEGPLAGFMLIQRDAADRDDLAAQGTTLLAASLHACAILTHEAYREQLCLHEERLEQLAMVSDIHFNRALRIKKERDELRARLRLLREPPGDAHGEENLQTWEEPGILADIPHDLSSSELRGFINSTTPVD